MHVPRLLLRWIEEFDPQSPLSLIIAHEFATGIVRFLKALQTDGRVFDFQLYRVRSRCRTPRMIQTRRRLYPYGSRDSDGTFGGKVVVQSRNLFVKRNAHRRLLLLLLGLFREGCPRRRGDIVGCGATTSIADTTCTGRCGGRSERRVERRGEIVVRKGIKRKERSAMGDGRSVTLERGREKLKACHVETGIKQHARVVRGERRFPVVEWLLLLLLGEVMIKGAIKVVGGGGHDEGFPLLRSKLLHAPPNNQIIPIFGARYFRPCLIISCFNTKWFAATAHGDSSQFWLFHCRIVRIVRVRSTV